MKIAYINFLNHCYVDTEVEMKEIYTSNHMWKLFENFLVDICRVSYLQHLKQRHGDEPREVWLFFYAVLFVWVNIPKQHAVPYLMHTRRKCDWMSHILCRCLGMQQHQ